MAINKNHEFDDLDGVKCAIVEKSVSSERVKFLKEILELNGFTVVVVKSPPPKVIAKPVAPSPADASAPAIVPTIPAVPEAPTAPETFTVGVTDSTFNATNAIFGRLLRTKDGHIVTLAYWQQKDSQSRDEVPYYETN